MKKSWKLLSPLECLTDVLEVSERLALSGGREKYAAILRGMDIMECDNAMRGVETSYVLDTDKTLLEISGEVAAHVKNVVLPHYYAQYAKDAFDALEQDIQRYTQALETLRSMESATLAERLAFSRQAGSAIPRVVLGLVDDAHPTNEETEFAAWKEQTRTEVQHRLDSSNYLKQTLLDNDPRGARDGVSSS